jgi:hypothetical protein
VKPKKTYAIQLSHDEHCRLPVLDGQEKSIKANAHFFERSFANRASETDIPVR